MLGTYRSYTLSFLIVLREEAKAKCLCKFIITLITSDFLISARTDVSCMCYMLDDLGNSVLITRHEYPR